MGLNMQTELFINNRNLTFIKGFLISYLMLDRHANLFKMWILIVSVAERRKIGRWRAAWLRLSLQQSTNELYYNVTRSFKLSNSYHSQVLWIITKCWINVEQNKENEKYPLNEICRNIWFDVLHARNQPQNNFHCHWLSLRFNGGEVVALLMLRAYLGFMRASVPSVWWHREGLYNN